MKKIIIFIVALLSAMSTWAYDVEIEGIFYNLDKNKKTATVTYSSEPYYLDPCYSGDIIIHDSFDYHGVTYTVTTIGEGAFDGCSGIRKVTIGKNVTTIEDEAFWGCTGIYTLSIPKSVTKIGTLSFGYCMGLKNVIVDKDNTAYCSFNSVIYSKDKSTLVYCMSSMRGQFAIPDYVTSIGDGAFSDCYNLSSIIIPTSVKKIGKHAFIGINVTSIIIPNSVTTIEVDAFGTCEELTSVTIPESVTSIGDDAFIDCNNLKSVTNYAKKPQTISNSTFTTYGTLHVLPGCKAAYEAVDYWKNFTIIEDADTYKPWGCSHIHGDVNGDGEVTIEDLTELVDLILKKK